MAIIPRVKLILSAPTSDPVHIGPLPFLLGWAQELAGDHSGETESWRKARLELENSLQDQPEGFSVMGILAMTYAALGESDLARRLANRAMTMFPIRKEALRAVT